MFVKYIGLKVSQYFHKIHKFQWLKKSILILQII